jgi:putative ABC transport system permease protein
MIREINFALRGLLKRPAFAVIVVLTLALGIGANTAIFSVDHSKRFDRNRANHG